MAKSREKSSEPKKKKRPWLRYLLMLLGGSGVGGWQLKDHPILQRLYIRATGEDPGDRPITARDAVKAVSQALSKIDAYRKPGEFEVRIKGLKLDRSNFREGQTLQLQVRLIKREPGARDQVVWDSKALGELPVKVGRDDLQLSWADSPIVVNWKPADTFVFEVWDRRGIFSTKWFEWTAGSEQTFPLRTGSYILSLAERSESGLNPRASQIVLESKPKGLERVVDTDVRSASGTRKREDDQDTIRIK
ncbi:MAG: hypothetical protein SFX72_15010 [Isosphaeraceae bacterium]|nr:hypothetical protein [Isosphaeraceae bacterium]